jgi:hypothetical protein
MREQTLIDRRSSASGRQRRVAKLIGSIACVAMSAASAQYRFDPSAADEQGPSIRYFGSAKDEKGALLPGVSVQIDGADSVYVFVTDEEGRFHANLPLEMIPEKVTSKCFKEGLRQLRVTTRPGPAGVKPSVQVDCVLRR